MTSWEISNVFFNKVPACCYRLLLGVGWGGQELRSFGKGKNRAATEKGRPRSTDLTSLIRAFIPKAPLSPLLASGLGGPVLEAVGLIEGIKHSIWGSCLSLRLLLFCNNSLFSAPYLFFPSTLSNDEVTGPG